MIIPKNILKFWGVFFIILAVALGVITLIYRWHRIFPTHEVSEIYSRYAKEEGIDAAFVKDYRVNDSVTVDVTVLEATTDSVWEVLLKYFNITPPPPEAIGLIDMDKPLIRLANRQDYALPADSVATNNDVLSIVFSDRRICVFKTESMEQIKAINYHLFEKMIDEKGKNNLQNDI